MEAGVDSARRYGNPDQDMLAALTLALADLFDRRLLPIWLKSVLATVLAVVVFGIAAFFALRLAAQQLAPGSEAAEILVVMLALFGPWLLWRIVALAVLQFFADDVVAAIEQRHYPEMAKTARKLGWREEARRSLGGAARAVLFNLLALPVALALLVTGLGAPLVFIAVNAILLGRELQDMVWLRHRLTVQSAAPLGPAQRLALGAITAVLLTVPVVNFAAPFLGAACAVHLIHRKGRK
ncbi:MAG: EI24 domain-containing protein [Novosphingobium sp.]|uniref:EI24 domain-containing protein n=1 Tax=Novosphingobium sp. TaxID=1874826 RepID=UPI0032BC8CF3